MSPLLLLAIGMAVVVGMILVLRANAFLSLITAVIDGILNNGYALTLALSNAAVAACHAIGGTPLREFGLFMRVSRRRGQVLASR